MPDPVLAGRSFQALALLTPPVAALAPEAVVPLLCLAGLPALLGAWRHGWRPAPDPVLLCALIAWAFWALASCAWTPEPRDAGVMWLRDGALLVLGVVLHDVGRRLTAESRRRITHFLLPGLAAGALAIGFELVTDHALKRAVEGGASPGDSDLNRGATTLVLWLPLMLVATRQWSRSARGAAAAAALAAIFATPSGTAVVALLAAGLGAGLAHLRLQLARVGLAAAMILGIAVMPELVALLDRIPEASRTRLPESIQHRLYIWDFTSRRIAERPILGWGFNSAEAMPNFGVEPFYADQTSVIPLHPHNAALQVRLDLGVPGIGIAVGLLAAIVVRAGRGHPHVAQARLAALAAAVTIACLAYGIWQEQWIATLVVVALLAQLADEPHGEDRNPDDTLTAPD